MDSAKHACYKTGYMQVMALRPCFVAASQQALRHTQHRLETSMHAANLACWKSMMVCLQVMALRPRFVAAAQQAQQAEDGNGGGYDEDDIEAVKGMARLFAELGESYTALIAIGTWANVTSSWYL